MLYAGSVILLSLQPRLAVFPQRLLTKQSVNGIIYSRLPFPCRTGACSVPVVSLVVYIKPMIGAFTSFLTPQPAENYNHQHFTDCLPHCNSPLTGFPDSIPIPPQSIFHSTARVILQKQKSNNIKWCSCYGKYYGGSSKI